MMTSLNITYDPVVKDRKHENSSQVKYVGM